MADVAMCKNRKCLLKENCYRYTANPYKYMQTYFDPSNMNDINGLDCNYFWYNSNFKIAGFNWYEMPSIIKKIIISGSKFGLKYKDIVASDKIKNNTNIRAIIAFNLHNRYKLSYSQISMLLNKDKSTISRYMSKYCKLFTKGDDFKVKAYAIYDIFEQ